MVKVGKLCIEVSPNDKIAWISEELCIGCGICVKVGGGRWSQWPPSVACEWDWSAGQDTGHYLLEQGNGGR